MIFFNKLINFSFEQHWKSQGSSLGHSPGVVYPSSHLNPDQCQRLLRIFFVQFFFWKYSWLWCKLLSILPYGRLRKVLVSCLKTCLICVVAGNVVYFSKAFSIALLSSSCHSCRLPLDLVDGSSKFWHSVVTCWGGGLLGLVSMI